MQAVIYIDILASSDQATYQKPILTWTKSVMPEIALHDFDNFSDNLMFNYANDLMAKAERCIVFIDIKNGGSSAKIRPLIEKILKNRSKCHLVMFGDDPMLDQMSKPLVASGILHKNISLTTQQSLIKDFFWA